MLVAFMEDSREDRIPHGICFLSKKEWCIYWLLILRSWFRHLEKFKTRGQMWWFRVEKSYGNWSFGSSSCPWPCNIVLLYLLLLRTDAEPNYCILWVFYKLPSIARGCSPMKSSCKDLLMFHFFWSVVGNMINSENTQFPGNICLKTQDSPLNVTIF